MSENSVFGLTEDEAAELDSEDEYFYGFTNDDNHLSCNEVNISDSEESDDKEGETSGILSDSDLQESVISFVSDTQGTRSSIPDIGVISSESDPLYNKIDEKLSEGCSCSISCLSQFKTNEVFRFHLMLCEMQKCEKDMLLLGKLQVISKVQDDTHLVNVNVLLVNMLLTGGLFVEMGFYFSITLEVSS